MKPRVKLSNFQRFYTLFCHSVPSVIIHVLIGDSVQLLVLPGPWAQDFLSSPCLKLA